MPRGVLTGVRRVKGGAVIAGELPLAPTKGFAAPILGSVGEVTAEMIEENPDVYSIGDIAGLSGLQARYDEQLRGTPGQAVNAVGSDGKTRELFRYDAVDGQPLQLTLDERLQIAAEQALANVGPAAALVAIKPSTGEILAAGQRPGDRWPEHRDVRAVRARARPSSRSRRWRCCGPGDTPDTVVPCTSSVVVDGKRFENYDDYPAVGPRQHPVAHGGRQLLQHRLHLPARQARPGLAGRRRRVARHGGRPRPRLPGVLRQRRAARRRDREGRRPDRPGQDPRLTDGDGHRDRLDPVRLAGGALARHERHVRGRRTASPARRRPRPPRCRGCCAAWSPTAAARSCSTSPARP